MCPIRTRFYFYPHAGGGSQGKFHLDHLTDDPDFGFGGVVDLRLMLRVGGLGHQGDGVAGGIEPLDGGILVAHHHHGHLAVLYLILPADNETVPIIDAQRVHAVSVDDQSEVFGTTVEVRNGIALDMLLRIEGEAGGDAAQNGDTVEGSQINMLRAHWQSCVRFGHGSFLLWAVAGEKVLCSGA